MQEILDPVPGRYRAMYPKRAYAMAGRGVEVVRSFGGSRLGRSLPRAVVPAECGREAGVGNEETGAVPAEV